MYLVQFITTFSFNTFLTFFSSSDQFSILSSAALKKMNTFVVFLMVLVIGIVEINSQANSDSKDSRISRYRGNILRNLTLTQEYEDHIVTSSLDNSQWIRNIYRGIREFYSRIVTGTGARHNSERFQTKVTDFKQFPCQTDGFRSKKSPKSVHQLRPGDIDIIAAVGDSLTSATGANSMGLWEGLVENRGLSWCIGGQGDWRSHLTLPNIIKEFNPNLFGYSLTDSYNVHQSAQFNVAENIATTSDMPYMARALMNRMKLDTR